MSQRKSNAYTFMFAAGVCIVCSVILAGAATALKPKQVANARLDIIMNILSAVGHDFNELSRQPPDQVFSTFGKEFRVLLLDQANDETPRDFMETELANLGYPEKELAELDTGALLNRFESKLDLLARRAGKSRAEYDPGLKALYIHERDGKPDAYVIPIQGFGLWDIIKGYVALDTDLNTIKGISFYEHGETPGLGARIVEDWFKDNFKGKQILDEEGDLVSITVAKGAAPTPAGVDGVSGATAGPHTVDGISGATLTGNGINQFLKRDLLRYEPYFKTLRTN